MFTRICPKCNAEVHHRSKDSLNHSKDKVCWTCANVNNAEKAKKISDANKGKEYNKSKLGVKESDETKQRKSIALKGRKPGFGGKKHTPETRQQMSECRAEMLRERFGKVGQLSPWYNKDACKLFDQLNEERGWNGQHAENGGEFYIGGYWLDYYEPKQNIVIEYDEHRHKIPSIAEKDVIKQDYVVEQLKCRFYRIDAESPTLEHIK